MTCDPRINLIGFEEALAKWIEDNFQFQSIKKQSSQKLEGGRNLFVQDMPEVEDVQETHSEFDPNIEPMIALFTDAGLGVVPTVSNGSRMEWNIRIVVRFGVVPELTKAFLEELIGELTIKTRGVRAGQFIVKGSNIVSRPTVFQRSGDQHAFANAIVKFFVVQGKPK